MKIYKKFTLFGIGTYLILAFFALFFYLERTAFVDISFHLFYILKDGTYTIQNNRFGSIFTQIFPLIGSKVGLSLTSIMKLYSVGFVLYYSIIFLIITRLLRSNRFGVLMVLLSTVMVTDTFYWIQSELPQGLAFMVLYFALIYSTLKNQLVQKWYFYPIQYAFLIFLVFFHPLLAIPFIFCSLFVFIHFKNIGYLFKSGLLFYLIILIIKSLFFKTAYDSNAMGGLSNFVRLFPNYFSIPSNIQFLLDLAQKYYILSAMLVFMIYMYNKTKQYIKMGLMVSFFIGYTLLVNVSYPEGASDFYIENLHLPLSIFVIMPLVFDFPKLSASKILAFLSLIVLVRVSHIAVNHTIYTQRIKLLQNYLNETYSEDNKKIVTSEDHFPMDTLIMSWATPYEIWLLSTTQLGETRSIMITDNVKEVEWTAGSRDKFVTKWGAFHYSELPKQYFILNDTSTYEFRY